MRPASMAGRFMNYIGVRIMATQRVSFCRFMLKKSFDPDIMVSNLLKSNEPSDYFVINEQGERYISGYYLVEQPRNETKYNIEANRFETVTTTRLTIIRFEIDVPNNILIIWGNRNCAQRLITLISQACNNDVVIDFYEIDFKNLIKRITIIPDITISKMKLENIVIDLGIVANCNVNMLNQDNPNELIKKYYNNISQISVIMGNRYSSDESVSLTVFSSGTIVVYKDRDSISEETVTAIQKIVI